MRRPLNRLKFLPWKTLFQTAVFTALVVLGIELLLSAMLKVPLVAQLFATLFVSPLGVLIFCAISIGIGALAVLILERLYRPGINTGSLWGLVLCLAIVFLVASFLPVPTSLLQFGYTQLVLMVVGVFWKGRPYWRSFRRW
ncbi:peptide chain release factor 1 [Kovacikia minuta CCNUW1]|uniref:peptide chain release factor 1 n=1 Tax=Kovacikia minuta TaxID=2931930 RepID=UPI001CC9D1F4|nr:peptide chain release factor 1 [Kovacikia minuta]UBF25293.1 peptide chain release factor 1 [Kovacikia minuta CCNUW1]